MDPRQRKRLVIARNLFFLFILPMLLLWNWMAVEPEPFPAPAPPVADHSAGLLPPPQIPVVVSADLATATAPLPAETPPPLSPSGEVLLRIHGRVAGEEGTGVAGMRVEIRAWSGDPAVPRTTTVIAMTGTDGTFEGTLAASLAALGFGVETRLEGRLEGWLLVKAGEYDEARGVEVVAPRARGIAGRVVDGSGRPLAGTVVQLWYGSETTWPTRAGEDGRFLTPVCAPRAAFVLIVEARGYPRRSIPLPAADEERTELGDIRFELAGDLSGVVVDAFGNPVPELSVCLTAIVEDPVGGTVVQTDGAGRFVFRDVGEGEVGVCVSPPGLGGTAAGKRIYRGSLGGLRAGGDEVRLEVRAECTVILRFVDAVSKEPLDVRQVRYGLRTEGEPEPERLPMGDTSDSPLTSSRVSVLSGARYDLTVRSPGFDEVRMQGLEVPDVAVWEIPVPLVRSR